MSLMSFSGWGLVENLMGMRNVLLVAPFVDK